MRVYDNLAAYLSDNPFANAYRRYFLRSTGNGKEPCAFVRAFDEPDNSLYPGGYVFVSIAPYRGGGDLYRVIVEDNAGLSVRSTPNGYPAALATFNGIKALPRFEFPAAMKQFELV